MLRQTRETLRVDPARAVNHERHIVRPSRELEREAVAALVAPLGIGAAAAETLLILVLRRRGSSAGRLMHGAELLSGPVPLPLRLAVSAVPALQLAAAVSAVAGSLLTRVAWIAAGRRPTAPSQP